MGQVLNNAWALLLGMLLLMLGNGLQGSLVGVRGGDVGFSTLEISLIMSGYFLGFLGGSRTTPELIRRVGHVRVFAALASFFSAALILFPAFTHPIAWMLLRVLIGFCISGIYVTAESWLNNAASNETRGQALSAYMIVLTMGMAGSQALLLIDDPSGFLLFIVPSVLVSISFAPILLSITPTPAFETAKPMTLRKLFDSSPLGCVGMFLLGGVFGAQFGMSAVYGQQAGFTLGQISLFVAMLFVGALVTQYPIGWLSDRMDRRTVILGVSLVGLGSALLAMMTGGPYELLLAAAFLVGAASNPLYSLLIAHTNDFLENDDMAAASGGLIFINGVGAVAGPIATGWFLQVLGADGFWLFMLLLFVAIASYAAYRKTRRPATPVEETGTYAPLAPSVTPVAVEVAQEVFIEALEEDAAQSTEDAA